MAFRQVARDTAQFDIQWPEECEPSAISEANAPEIGAFLHRLEHPLHRSCEQGTLKGATYYVTRLFDYHRNDTNFPLSLSCSTLARDTATGCIVGVCMVGGGGPEGKDFGIYDILVNPAYRNRGIASGMIRRALTVLAEHGVPSFYLWRNDDSLAVPLYERLGFVPTGQVE